MRFAVAIALLLVSLVAPGGAKAQSVGFQPGIGVLNDGVSLNVTPVVSADRRYVRLSLDAQFQSVTGLSNFPIPAAVSGGGGGGGRGLGGFRSVMGPADFAAWYPDLGIPRATDGVTRLPTKPLQPKTGPGRSRKPEPDPVIVPIKKAEKKPPG